MNIYQVTAHYADVLVQLSSKHSKTAKSFAYHGLLPVAQ